VPVFMSWRMGGAGSMPAARRRTTYLACASGDREAGDEVAGAIYLMQGAARDLPPVPRPCISNSGERNAVGNLYRRTNRRLRVSELLGWHVPTTWTLDPARAAGHLNVVITVSLEFRTMSTCSGFSVSNTRLGPASCTRAEAR
jgi:hypothetical protein